MTDAQLTAILGAARKRFWQGRAVKLALVIIVGVGVLADIGLAELVWPGQSQTIGLWVLMGALGIWMLLSMTSAANVRLIGAAGAYTGAQQFDLAERTLMTAATNFSLYQSISLLAIYNLAVLAHGQGRFAQAAWLCGFLQEFPSRSADPMGRRSLMILAESELMLGQLPLAYQHLSALRGRPLSQPEQLALLPTTCYYEVCVNRWDYLVQTARARVELARLLPAPQSAVSLACLAMGFQQMGYLPQRDWLWQQATLLLDRQTLIDRFPQLAALPGDRVMKLPWPSESDAGGANLNHGMSPGVIV